MSPISDALPLSGTTVGAGHATWSSRLHLGQTSLALSTAYFRTVCALLAMALISDGNGATRAAGGESQVAGTLVGVSVGSANGPRAGDLVRGHLRAPAGAPHTVRTQVLVQQTTPTLAAPDPCARTLAVAVVSDREFVAALFASTFFKSAQALVTLAVRSTDRSTTASWCFALWTTHAPRPSSTHHALFAFFAPYFRAALSARTTLYSSTKNPPEEETSAIQILLGIGGRCCCIRRAAVFSRDAL